MEVKTNTEWSAYVVGQMHKYRITGVELASRCKHATGDKYSPTYLSSVLNGKKEFSGPEAEAQTRDVILAALEGLVAEREVITDEN